MVRPPEYRQKKFVAKIDADVIRDRFLKEKDFMKEQTANVFARQEDFETQVGKILFKHELTGIQIHHYRNFSQELFSLTRRFEGLTLNREATIIAQKWIARGLDAAILKEIALLFAITLSV